MIERPAEIVISRFGGRKAVADAIGQERTSVQRWTYDPPNGTGGKVPTRHWARLIESAKAQGIDLDLTDLLPADLRD